MSKIIEIPDCTYTNKPYLITPCAPTPKHKLYLSNLDDQRFLRFSIKYLYLFKKSVEAEWLKFSLSKVLVEYYPLAGRVRVSSEDAEKLEVDCNSEGALFVEAYVNLSVEEFLEGSQRPNASWRKLLFKVDSHNFVGAPLIIQVTHLRCGGMILCTGISHCLCDGIGTVQFLQAWEFLTRKPNAALHVSPFHERYMLKPRTPPQITSSHPEFTCLLPQEPAPILLNQFLQCQNHVPISATFSPTDILQLKKLCIPS
ncbi:hypothetical protein HPP92_013421 [Vanilla planifolia]|uniref:Omega-hydroxypalmitate O-feruloyl transferase n=1 Tax=Vanilla planifolia TaxID=51239 RepID=A0A835QUM0_VANPL|nr:hypothetical protein HPP92_013421 [Vanilla planifolia]